MDVSEKKGAWFSRARSAILDFVIKYVAPDYFKQRIEQSEVYRVIESEAGNLRIRIVDLEKVAGELERSEAAREELADRLNNSETDRKGLEESVSGLENENARLAKEKSEIEATYERDVEALRVEVGERDETISGLERELRGIRSALDKAENSSWAKEKELKRIYEKLRVVQEENAQLSKSPEASKLMLYEEIRQELEGLKRLHIATGIEIDDETRARGIFAVIKWLKHAAQEADARTAEMRNEIRRIKERYILAQVNLYLEDNNAVFVLDDDNRIEAISRPAEEILGIGNGVGETAACITKGLGAMIGHVAPTYEPGFYLDDVGVGTLKKADLQVHIERSSKDNNYLCLFLVVEKRKKPHFWHRMSDQEKLEEVVSMCLVNGKERIMDLSKATEVSDEVAKRIYGLSLSKYFRDRVRIVVGNQEVFDKLAGDYKVPRNMIKITYDRGEAPETSADGEAQPSGA